MINPQHSPKDLAKPFDDGACNHLIGMPFPEVSLPATTGEEITLSTISNRVVIYCYPMTARPDTDLPEGWDTIPGARGCTPQSCSFRDHYQELKNLGAEVYGLSVQDTEYQKEMAERLHLPFAVLSDEHHQFQMALSLPTFRVDKMILIKRLTIIAQNGTIEAVHYPVFPSDSDPSWVIEYLKDN